MFAFHLLFPGSCCTFPNQVELLRLTFTFASWSTTLPRDLTLTCSRLDCTGLQLVQLSLIPPTRTALVNPNQPPSARNHQCIYTASSRVGESTRQRTESSCLRTCGPPVDEGTAQLTRRDRTNPTDQNNIHHNFI